MSISNPFASAGDTDANATKVRIVEADMLRKHGVTINVPRTSYFEDFMSLGWHPREP